MKLPSSSTLSLSFLPGQTFALALCILALIAGASEAAARLWLDGSSVPVAVGSANTPFDQKIGLLDDLAARDGGVERYRPRLLVYGLTLRAVAQGASDSGRIYADITGTPWVQYRRGAFSVTGWLTEHSSAFRHYLAYRNWMKHEFANRLSEHRRAPRSGYTPFVSTRPLDPATISTPPYFDPFAFSPQELAGLDRVLALQGQTQVVLVDMPLPQFFREQFAGGAGAYAAYIDELGARAAAAGVPLWQTNPLDMIPGDGWAQDGQHVNATGARILSRWLGERLAQGEG